MRPKGEVIRKRVKSDQKNITWQEEIFSVRENVKDSFLATLETYMLSEEAWSRKEQNWQKTVGTSLLIYKNSDTKTIPWNRSSPKEVDKSVDTAFNVK